MAKRLSRDVLSHLCSYLSPHLPAAIKVHGLAQNAAGGNCHQEFWVDAWPDPKAVVVTPVKEVAYISNVYSVFATDQSALKDILHTEGVVDWRTSVMFAAVTQDYFPTLEEVSAKHGCRLDTRDTELIDIYCADKDSLQLVDLPKNLALRELNSSHVHVVNDTWAYSYGKESLAYFEFLIKNHPSLGLFDEKGNLLAFELMTYYGAMGTLYVMPEHRRKGYASCVISALAQRTLAAGRTPLVFLDQKNDMSICLHRKMGFKKADFGPVSWIRTETKECGSCSKPAKCCV